ncbi:hypothetical protein [Lactococcus petauri]|uniref:hypothetical protein n=1 Tax=Lactococcus petauri TaxID=1940789 RepID=UPI0002D4EC72|nr:hypothetical protein [Lactococcus petauri]
MTQETAKEHLYSKLNEVKTNHDKALNVYGTQTMNEVLKIVDSYFENLPSNTDELTVEKLQEHLLPYKKEMVQKIIDEKMQLVTADEFLKLHKESLTAIRENDKLQEQLNTAKKYIEHVIGTIKHDGHLGTIQTDWILPDLEKALSAIGGDDGQ